MVPQPRKQNPQRQPLTVALRKICRDYPAGTGILKELLQNADDAGASTLKFVLDTSTYPDSPVLVDGLSEYQGPALLAYNDALFTEKDFQSLTSLGDSKKLQDKHATGKFGLGFSSVFNWTDSPSILSGSTLLFLDPHLSWSRGFDPPGGPEYDFTASRQDEAMKNQLLCFSLLQKDWELPFPGTIIRIPLRNTSQAGRSEISRRETTKEDVQKVLDSFAKEMGSNGLLFLKSVRHIILSVDDEQLSEVEVVNRRDLAVPKQRLKDILLGTMNCEDGAGGEVFHQVHLRHRVAERETIRRFGILNLVADCIHDGLLENWAASEKLFPWVAVAAPLKAFDSSELGRLFSTLPLPSMTGFPVHIHGLFSITADRSRLHGLDDSGVQDHRPKEWNKFLFSRLIPKAWAKLLVNICKTYPTRDHSHLLPPNRPGTPQLWDRMCRALLDEVYQNHLRVWFTHVGYVTLEDGLLGPQQTPPEAKSAFREAGLPIIYLADHILDEARQLVGGRILNPETVYQSFRGIGSVKNISGVSRLVMLEYFLPQIPLSELGDLEIFPFADGNFRSLISSAVFLHRSKLENTLFSRDQTCVIALEQLSEEANRLMHQRAKGGDQLVRYRNPEDLRDYYQNYIASGSGDSIVLDKDEISTLRQIWQWILHCNHDELPLSALGCLWLLPLRGSKIRRLVPADNSNFATWFDPGEVNDVAHKIFASDPESAPQILAYDAFSNEIWLRLRIFADRERLLCIKNGNKFKNFLGFLIQGQSLIQTAAEDVKEAVLYVLMQLYWSQGRQRTDDGDCIVLKNLCLFRAIQWPDNATDLSLTRSWIHLTGDTLFIGLRKLVPVPQSPNQVFVDVTDEGENALFTELGLLRCLNEIQILEEVAIPALLDGSYNNMNPIFRLEVCDLLFENYYRISETKQTCLSNLAVVPLEKQNDGSTLSFGRPLDILDPRQRGLKKLYFDDEITLPQRPFYDRFSAILADCGMVNSLTERVVLDRIQSYGRRGLQVSEVATRAKALLLKPFPRDSARSDCLDQLAREIKWLPGRSPDNNDSIVDSSRCRDQREMYCVGHVWHILPFRVNENWISILGWDTDIDVLVLIYQLDASIAASDFRSVERTLSYMCQRHSTENYIDHLLKLSFVRTTNGELVNAGKVCRRGSEKLTPYLYAVEPRFWDNYRQIMNLMNVPENPSLEQLKEVQRALGMKNALSEEDLDVAVEVAHIWGILFSESLDGLKVPTHCHSLVDACSVVFNDAPWLPESKRPFMHGKVSQVTAERLKIEPLSEMLRKGDLGIVDPDEDEFYQREEVADGIKDTLERYTRESTFHEYLANADDCGSASEVNFFLDTTNYGTERLLTKELHDLQGSSLLIHNNGVFTETDFEGLKRVGRGSKRDDPTVIGKFGRGSQTMYHWTDVPMIVSGAHLLILDPLRKYLPFNYRTRQKKPGILLKYAKLKQMCEDQLAPFEGRWGFDSNQPFYNGTIFRFPLRREGGASELLESRKCPDVPTTIDIFRRCIDEARLALLFLRNIGTIDFGIKPGISTEWRVRRSIWPPNGAFSDWANVRVEQHSSVVKLTVTMERWWRVIVHVAEAPAHLQHRHKRRMKDVECGIAGLVSKEQESTRSSLQPLRSRFFNCLPLKFESTLPVQIHATFLLSGDRQNIATEETSQDAGSEWNVWLLQQKLPSVYLMFLEDIGRQIGHDVYRFFPTHLTGRKEQLSDLLRASFWDEIGSSPRRVFPIVNAFHDPELSRPTGRGKRTTSSLVEFKSAIFDILAERESVPLRPILCGCEEYLVRPPIQLRSYIKGVPGVKLLTAAIVRCALKIAHAREHVEGMEKASLNALLSFVMPTNTAELHELDGCPLLPLANGTLGTLSLKSSISTGLKTMYYATAPECRELFSFASSLLSTGEVHATFVEKILDSGLFNLKTLERVDVGILLRCKESWVPSKISATSKAWLLRFWQYMNSGNPSTKDPANPHVTGMDSLQDFPLLLLRHHCGKETTNSLRYFQSNAVAVQSTVQAHMNVFADFLGLHVVDARTVPESFRQAEQSLDAPSSFVRFLKSLILLANKDAKSLTEFVRANLKENNIKTLQDIVLKVKSTMFPLPEPALDLPLWPRIASKPGYLTAREAIVAENSAFVVPWIKDYDRFTDATSLTATTIDSTVMLRDYVLPYLPVSIKPANKAPYSRLIGAINSISPSLRKRTSKRNSTRVFVVPLATKRLAAREDGQLSLTSDLFDHTDAVFTAAFRLEASSRFLMSEVRLWLGFWREIGLRHRENGMLKGSDYVACLSALEGRLVNPQEPSLASDTEIVLQPLRGSDGFLYNMDPMTRSTIVSLQIFPVSPVSGSEPQFRKLRMNCLASQKSTLCLKDIVGKKFVAVCWSQTAFALHEPSPSSLEQVHSKGQPSGEMVWQHLTFLAELARLIKESEVPSFLEDLRCTYEFLLLHLQESKNTYREQRAAIWFNAETVAPSAISLSALRTSWTTLENLLIDSPCDAPPLMTVQAFLGRFSPLLRELGCKSLYYPPISLPPTDAPQTALGLLRELWEAAVLTDVTFEAEGSTISAHKIILASRSLYCKKMFHGPWALASDNNTHKTISLVDMAYATVKILVEFCYNENHDWAASMRVKEDDGPPVIADKLDSLLDVLVAADRWVMPDLHTDAQRQVVAGIRFFIRPDNVKHVSKVAEEANASELRVYCEEYVVRNAAAVLLTDN